MLFILMFVLDLQSEVLLKSELISQLRSQIEESSKNAEYKLEEVCLFTTFCIYHCVTVCFFF